MKLRFAHIILFLVALPLSAQVTFKSKTSKTQLGLNERLRIEFTIDKQGADDFTPPDFRNFKVLAGPSQSTSFSSINGRTSYKLTYTYIIQPVAKGTFTIPSAKINFDGEQISSNTVRVTVTDAVVIPEDPDDPRYLASKNIHLVAEVSNRSPYIGESVAVKYKLYVNTNKVRLQNTREASSPSYNGFWKQNIEVKKWVAKNGTYNGEPHRYAVVKKVVLIPNKSGKLEIDPLEMEVTAGVPIGRRDFFGNMLMNDINFTATSGKVKLDVKPLPIEGKPANFNGAVGDFRFNVEASKTELNANESASIKVEVAGRGNLKLVDLPGIEAPQGLEVFPPDHQEKISTSLNGMTGKIYDQYAVVPQYRGKYKLPEISFSYFNPKDEKYHTINAPSIILNAVSGKIPVEEQDQVGTPKQHIVGNENDIRYIETKSTFVPIGIEDHFYGSTWFYLLLLLPLLAVPVGMFIGQKQRERALDVVGTKQRKADRLARKYLSAAKKELGNKEAFYIALERAMHNYLKAKLHVETFDISQEKIGDILNQKQVNQAHIKDLLKVLDNCDYARYTPSTDVEMQREYEHAKTVITQLDKQL